MSGRYCKSKDVFNLSVHLCFKEGDARGTQRRDSSSYFRKYTVVEYMKTYLTWVYKAGASKIVYLDPTSP